MKYTKLTAGIKTMVLGSFLQTKLFETRRLQEIGLLCNESVNYIPHALWPQECVIASSSRDDVEPYVINRPDFYSQCTPSIHTTGKVAGSSPMR
jgi:hypothetical protein